MDSKTEGVESGQKCNRNGCEGVIFERDIDGGCSCHINPPCSYCETPKEECDTCGWNAEDEMIEYNKAQAQLYSSAWEEERKLREASEEHFLKMWRGDVPVDKLTIRSKLHTRSSMIKYGVFPKNTETRQSIIAKCRGSFGGRFTMFDENFGRFEFIAYTD